jgi:hypothetical protein
MPRLLLILTACTFHAKARSHLNDKKTRCCIYSENITSDNKRHPNPEPDIICHPRCNLMPDNHYQWQAADAQEMVIIISPEKSIDKNDPI